jgi:hypothetical protein
MDAISQWLRILDRIQEAGARGQEAFVQIKGVLAAHSIEAETAALDAVIANATRREAIAAREAGRSGLATPEDGKTGRREG